MVLGLKEIQIRGEIRTNVDYSIDLLHVIFTISLNEVNTVINEIDNVNDIIFSWHAK